MPIFADAYAQSASRGLLSVLSSMPRPSAGSTRYKITLSIVNGRSQAENPDGANVYLRVVKPDDAEFGGTTRLYDAATGGAVLGDSGDGTYPHAGQHWVIQDAALRTGTFVAFLEVASTDTDEPALLVEAAWYEQGRAQSTSVVTKIGDAADMDDVASDASDAKTASESADTKIGTPISSVSADIASVQTEVDKIGTPSGTLATDIAAVQTEVDKIGTPAGADVSADIAAIKAQTAAIEVDTQAIETDTQDLQSKLGTPLAGTVASNIEGLDTTLGTPAGADVSADIAAVKAQTQAIETDTQAIETDTQDIQGTLGSPVGADLSADIAAVKAQTAAIEVDTTSIETKVDGVQTDLDNGTDGLGALKALIDSVQSSVDGVQNNTRFTASVPTTVRIPISGTDAVEFMSNLYDSGGSMEDPDEQEIAIRLKQAAGTYITDRLYKEAALSNALDNPHANIADSFPAASGWRAMEREAVGKMFAFYKNDSGHSAEELVIEFGWEESTVPIFQARSISIVDLVDTADAVWDETLSGHSGVGSTGKALIDVETDVTAILEDTSTTLPATLSTIEGKVDTLDTVADAILEDTSTTLPATLSTIEGKVDTADAAIDAVQVDLGDFSGQTNLQSLLAVVGGYFDDADVTLADYLNVVAELFEVVSSGVVTTHADMTTEPAQGDTYLGATSGTTYTWQSTFQDGSSTETKGYWTYSGGTGPQEETLNRQTGSGDAAVTVYVALTGIKIQEYANGAPLWTQDNFYQDKLASVLNGAERLNVGIIAYYDGASAVMVWYTTSLLTPAAGDTVAIPRENSGVMGLADDTSFGSPMSVLSAIVRVANTYLGDPTEDTLASYLAKIGDQGDVPTDQSILGLIGDPVDGAGEAVAESSLFARLRQLENDIAAVAAGGGTQRTCLSVYPWQASGVLSAHPTSKADASSNTTQSTSYVIVDKKTVVLPEGISATINSVIAHLKWTSGGVDGGGGGNGDTKFMISPANIVETAGSAPSVNAADITSEMSMSTSTVIHEVSGNLADLIAPVAVSGGFHLLLCAKVDDAQDTANSSIYDESACEIDYEV